MRKLIVMALLLTSVSAFAQGGLFPNGRGTNLVYGDVDFANYKATNVSAITLGGESRTNWPDPNAATGFVSKAGDTMTGPLVAPSIYKTDIGSVFVPTQVLNYAEMDTVIGQYAAQSLYGATNYHPVLPAASMRDEVPATVWTNVIALSDGMNYIGTWYYYKPVVGFIPAGEYLGHFFCYKTANGTAQAGIQVVVSDGVTTNVLATSGLSGQFLSSIGSFDVRADVLTNHVVSATNWYLGVRYYGYRVGGPVTMYTLGGTENYPTKLRTPNLSSYQNYVLPSQIQLPQFFVSSTQVWSIAAGVDNKDIPFDVVRYQRGGVLSSNRWTPGVVGYVTMSATVTCDGEAVGTGQVRFRKNGANLGWSPFTTGSGNRSSAACVIMDYNDATTNVYSVVYYSSIAATNSGSTYTWWCGSTSP